MGKEFIKKVADIQLKLKAPKTQYNKFGEYNYRNLEDILMAVKPILDGLVLTISDDIKLVGTEIYVFSTATLTDGESEISNTAAARETMVKKKYDSSQLTGSASSYARKYCLNGLFGIDDTRDADSENNEQQPKPQQQTKKQDDDKPWYSDAVWETEVEGITNAIRGGMSTGDVIRQIAQKFKVATKYRDLIKSI